MSINRFLNSQKVLMISSLSAWVFWADGGDGGNLCGLEAVLVDVWVDGEGTLRMRAAAVEHTPWDMELGK